MSDLGFVRYNGTLGSDRLAMIGPENVTLRLLLVL